LLAGEIVPRLVVYSLAILSVIIIVGGYIGWTLVNSHQSTEPLQTLTPEPIIHQNQTLTTNNTATDAPSNDEFSPTQDPSILIQQQVEQTRNDAIMYLQTNHPEVMFLFTGDEWQGGVESTNNQVTQRYFYYVGSWNVTVEFTAAINPTFSVSIKYFGDWEVNWQGTNLNATVNESSFSSNIPQTTPIAK
jgi:hypothetical protein